MRVSSQQETDIEKVYKMYADMLFRISYSALLSKEDAEDAVHEVFMKYLNRKPHFKSSEHEKAWLIRVTLNQCKDIGRRKKIRKYTPLDEIIESPKVKEDSIGILEQVFALPEKYKTAIILHYFEGYSIEEISSALKLTKSAVKMRLLRGREYLKKEMDKEGNDYV
ncbi:MAG: RNA polymerase sigma factor [Clostridiales bacterium]|nr:RNA polymerase sigma factor [Clostridiales bacterium]